MSEVIIRELKKKHLHMQQTNALMSGHFCLFVCLYPSY